MASERVQERPCVERGIAWAVTWRYHPDAPMIAGLCSASVLWRPLVGTIDQRVGARETYQWDNHVRTPGQSVVQITHEGELTYREGGRSWQVAAGEALIFQHGEASSYGTAPVPHAPYRCDWLCLEGAGLDDHLRALTARFGPVFPADGAMIAAVRRLVGMCTQASPLDAMVAAGACHALVLQLWRTLEDRQRAIRPRAEQAVDAILADPCLPWSLKEWAEHFQVSREHLCRTFRIRTGVAPSRWIAARKVERARQLASDTHLPTRDIIALAGITSRFALRRLMRRKEPP